MPTTAKVICDSISESGQRLTTFVLEYPRIIHSEFMTHRMFSRNASSSRAIPISSQIQRIKDDGFTPSQFGKNKKGMQSDEDLGVQDSYESRLIWQGAKQDSILYAERLNELGVHKQLANRLLEPFSYIQVVVTATEWEGFFAQRLHPAAQPEIQELAKVMKEAMDSSTPARLSGTECHLPFIDMETRKALFIPTDPDYPKLTNFWNILSKISVARCARVSYGLNERGWGDIEKDLALYDMLLTSGHWSPFEHQATSSHENPMELVTYNWPKGVTHVDKQGFYWSGNFKGWVQNRQLIQQQSKN